MVRFTRLKQLGKPGMRRGQRFRRKHLAEQKRAFAELVLLHEHAPIHGLGFPGSAWPALLIVVGKEGAMRHNHPAAPHPHPLMARDRDWLPRSSRRIMPGG